MYDGNPREIDFGSSYIISKGWSYRVNCTMLKNKQNISSIIGENY